MNVIIQHLYDWIMLAGFVFIALNVGMYFLVWRPFASKVITFKVTNGYTFHFQIVFCIMIYYILKIVITVLLIVAIAEISKRSTLIGAILASIPLVSVLAMTWLYVDTKDVHKVAMLSSSVFWLVLPSLALFLILPVLLKKGINFYFSMGISVIITIIFYFIMIAILQRFGIKL